MNSFKIISDSSCDIPTPLMRDNDIDFVPFYVSFDGSKYYREHFDISLDDFYNKMLNEKLFPKTSLPSVQDYVDKFKPYLEDGIDILCFCLTSKFSGSYQSAVNAKGILDEEYPDRKLIVIDSYNVSAGQGLLVLEAVKMRDAGYSIDKCAEIIEKIKQHMHITFTIDSLEHIRRGGRIGAASALMGSLLNIKPLAQVMDGELRPYSKVRGRKKAIAEIINIVLKVIGDKKNEYEFAILNSCCVEEAEALAYQLKEEYGIIISLLSNVGVTIGCHSGPTALGIAVLRKYNTV